MSPLTMADLMMRGFFEDLSAFHVVTLAFTHEFRPCGWMHLLSRSPTIQLSFPANSSSSSNSFLLLFCFVVVLFFVLFLFCFYPSRKLSYTGSKMTLPLASPTLSVWKMPIWDSLSIGTILFFKPWLVLCCSSHTLVLEITQLRQTHQSALSLKLQGTHFKFSEWSCQSPYSSAWG